MQKPNIELTQISFNSKTLEYRAFFFKTNSIVITIPFESAQELINEMSIKGSTSIEYDKDGGLMYWIFNPAQ